jgi:hypothetical protein
MVADQRTQLKITFQLDEYRHARGAFQEGKAIVKRTNISPGKGYSFVLFPFTPFPLILIASLSWP